MAELESRFPNPTPTRVFASHASWVEAGRPIGGVMPVPAEERDPQNECWPDRYKGLAVVYYVALPTGQLWCPWQRGYDPQKGGWHGDGWTIKGPPECLTASPSIRVSGYHGYLVKGILSPDDPK